MTSILKADTIQDADGNNIINESGNTITIGASGDTTNIIGTLQNNGAALTGKIIQIVNVTDGTTATGTTLVPPDNTIPQNTEGTEFMTLAITPTNASNKLLIQVVIVGSLNITNNCLLYTSPSPRDRTRSRMPSSA